MDAVGVETLLKGPAELSGAAESPLAIQTKAFFMLPVVAQSVLLDTDAQQNRTDAQILGLKEYHRQTEELLQATIKERDCIMELKEILFIVEEDPEGGYTAQTFGESIFTEGDTIDAIKINIKDALRCHFEQNEIPIFVRLHIVREEQFAYA